MSPSMHDIHKGIIQSKYKRFNVGASKPKQTHLTKDNGNIRNPSGKTDLRRYLQYEHSSIQPIVHKSAAK